MKKNKVLAITVITALSALFFISCGGNEHKEETKPAEPAVEKVETAPAPVEEVKAATGEEIYKKTCQACHQANGEGIAKTFPPLAKSDFLSHKESVIEQVIKGKTGEMTVNGQKYNSAMPPQVLNDNEIAEVLNYVYASWGNDNTKISVDEVKAIREKTK